MRTSIALAALAALATSSVAIAQQTRTKTFEGENVSASTTTTIDRENGTLDRQREATNLNTGRTASSSFNRLRTENGAIVSGSQTGPQGRTRSFSGERLRHDNGSTFSGTATGRAGQTYDLFGERSRDGQGNSRASQRITNSEGRTVYSRERTTSRSHGSLNRSVSRQRDPNSRPRRVRPR
jgi:hypothetical protein